MPEFTYAGTVSHGTLRNEDLIPKFEEVLDKLDHDELVRLRYRMEGQPGDSEDFDEYVVNLIDALNEVAPEGYYFGSVEGDGSDFGFWKMGEES